MNDDPNQAGIDIRDRARILSEAVPDMRRHAGAPVVVKYGGHAMGDDGLARLFARDIVLLRQIGVNPIVVHGGGPQIGAMLERLEIKSEFVDGLRVTDQAAVDVVEMVLSGAINKQIVAAIDAAGGRAVGLSGKDAGMIKAERLTRTKRDPDSNIEKVVDLGFVGEPKDVSPDVLNVLAGAGMIPVIAPLGVGPAGETLNINADTVAGAIAGASNAARLVLLTDVAGVMDGDGHLVSEMSAADARRMIDDGTATGGMIPKLGTCLDAIDQGVESAVILDGRVPHAILVELFTAGGAGTMIRGD